MFFLAKTEELLRVSPEWKVNTANCFCCLLLWMKTDNTVDHGLETAGQERNHQFSLIHRVAGLASRGGSIGRVHEEVFFREGQELESKLSKMNGDIVELSWLQEPCGRVWRGRGWSLGSEWGMVMGRSWAGTGWSGTLDLDLPSPGIWSMILKRWMGAAINAWPQACHLVLWSFQNLCSLTDWYSWNARLQFWVGAGLKL